jgi:hypothetical protein
MMVMSGGAAVDRLRWICLSLPGVSERFSHGEVSFSVRRQFVAVDGRHHGADRVLFCCPAPPGALEQLIAEDRCAFLGAWRRAVKLSHSGRPADSQMPTRHRTRSRAVLTRRSLDDFVGAAS